MDDSDFEQPQRNSVLGLLSTEDLKAALVSTEEASGLAPGELVCAEIPHWRDADVIKRLTRAGIADLPIDTKHQALRSLASWHRMDADQLYAVACGLHAEDLRGFCDMVGQLTPNFHTAQMFAAKFNGSLEIAVERASPDTPPKAMADVFGLPP